MKTNKAQKENTTQKTKEMSNTDPTPEQHGPNPRATRTQPPSNTDPTPNQVYGILDYFPAHDNTDLILAHLHKGG